MTDETLSMPLAEPHTSALPDPDHEAEAYADVPLKRLIAWVIDSVVIAALTLLVVPFTAFTALFFLPLLWFTVGFIYRVFTLTRRSATLGMQMMAIELRTQRGLRFGLEDAALHTFLYTLCALAIVPQLISAGAMLVTPRRQGLHDLVMGSAALTRRR